MSGLKQFSVGLVQGHHGVTEVGLGEWAQTVQCRSGTGAPRCYRGMSQ